MLKAPFPWFGGKSRAAHLIWARLGDVPNYVEPFAGSLAVLLGRPTSPGTETVNDRDAYLANFWRAVQADPEAVWGYADQPVIEADLHARHVWLLEQADFRERILSDPGYYDVKVAGWWVWGLSLWIGDGWCAYCTDRPDRFQASAPQAWASMPQASGTRVRPRRPTRQLPELGTARGVLSQSVLLVKCQHLGRSGLSGSSTARGGVFDELAERLRDVRIACGDWSRVVTPSVTWRHGITGVVLDPPYSSTQHAIKYSGGNDMAADVRAWAIAHGDNPLLRIVLCGYDTEHAMPDGWASVAWKAHGGYGSQGTGRGRENASRETLWFSPHCLPAELPLFAEVSV